MIERLSAMSSLSNRLVQNQFERIPLQFNFIKKAGLKNNPLF